jgi:hypothetical protein
MPSNTEVNIYTVLLSSAPGRQRLYTDWLIFIYYVQEQDSSFSIVIRLQAGLPRIMVQFLPG